MWDKKSSHADYFIPENSKVLINLCLVQYLRVDFERI